jgi:hypothetical protein
MKFSATALRTPALMILMVVGIIGTTHAQTIGPITFTEPEFPLGTPVQGLTISTLDGSPLPAPLSFDFPDTDATIGSGPSTQTYVDPPGIEGPSDLTLVIDFGTAVDSAEFGFAVSCPPVVINALDVELFDGSGASVGTFSFDGLDTGFGNAENLVSISGVVFRSLEATWNDCGQPGGAWNGEGDPGGASRFFLDNLTYDPATGVPTMGSAMLLALGVVLAVVALWFLRRKTVLA